MMEVLEQLLFGDLAELPNPKTTVDYLIKCPVEDLFIVVEQNRSSIPPITAKLIPQFSKLDDVDKVVQIINDSYDASTISRQYIGYMINKNASELAQTKYGENHLKLAIMLGLVKEKPYVVTSLGKEYLRLSVRDRHIVRDKLAMRIPMIQYLLVRSKNETIDGTEYMKSVLSEKTAIRRRSNVRKLINNIGDLSSADMKKQILDNIVWS